MRRRKAKAKVQPRIVELNMDDVRSLASRAEREQFERGDGKLVGLVIASHCELLELLRNNEITLGRLRRMLFGAATEKTKNVLPDNPDPDPDADPDPDPNPDQIDLEGSSTENDSPDPAQGHGRNGADAYSGAERVPISHESLEPGDSCPECGDGKVYDMNRPGVVIRIIGQAPLQATVYELQKVRCNLCGKVFTAPLPEGVGSQRCDATAGTVIALLKYGSGLPFNRLRRLQGSVGVPLPAATQWDIVHAKAKLIAPAHEELIRQAAQGDVLYNDDTNNRILEFMGERARKAALQEAAREEEKTESPADKDRETETTQRHVHDGDRLPVRGPPDRDLFHGTPAQRRKPWRCTSSARLRAGAAHSDVRCAFA